jgi:hypothetical protein
MNGGHAGLICGFGDAAAGLAGLAWDLGEPGGLLLSDGQARPATFALEEGGDAATLELTAGDATVEATLSPRAASLPLAGDPHGPEVTACEAEVRSMGGTQTIICRGQIDRWSRDPTSSAALFRQIVVEGADQSSLVAVATGQPGAAGHGEERTAAWQLEGENGAPFEEALISTQYDGAGQPTRFGLELWPQDAERATRAAAVRVSGSLLGAVKDRATWAGVFGCHTDGHEGVGSYLLWRG